MPDDIAQAPLSGRTVAALAGTAALTAANLYYNQPLLAQLQKAFGVSMAAVGTLPMLTQIGYAVGMALFIPLGDRFERRRLILMSLAANALALLAAACSPNLPCLCVASAVLGLTTMAPQLVVPFAAQLAAPAQRAGVIGTVVSGLLLGILMGRTVSGAMGTLWGWRSVFFAASGVMLVLLLLVRTQLPRSNPNFHGSYVALMRSVLRLYAEEPVLRTSAAVGALLFSTFSAFWSSLPFLLAAPPFSFTPQATGMFGLVAAAGALASSLVGRFVDRASPRALLTGNLVLLAASWAILAASGASLWGLVVGVLALDMSVQGGHVLNQTRIFSLREDARSRLNTAYMTAYFAGGAAGSYAGVLLYAWGGWLTVCASNALMVLLALVILRWRGV